MKQSHLVRVLFATVLANLFISCGGDGSKEEEKTDTTVAETTTAVTPTPASTIVTTPETMMIVTFKVADFAKWQSSYETGDSMRDAYGIRKYVVGRGVNDSNMVMVVSKINDVAKAKEFRKSAALKQAMQRSGVRGTPSVEFAKATWQDTANIGQVIRSRTTFTVKDWATWLPSFEAGKQERMDNGITERVVGHDVDDDKKVMLVMAVLDSAKAGAYWASDALKKRREAGGVTSEPKRFLFRVAKRY